MKTNTMTSTRTKTAKPAKTAAIVEAATPISPDFADVVNHLALLSETTTRLSEIEAQANAALLELVNEHKAEYAQLQEAALHAETTLETLCRKHPEWFASVRTLKTPYGKVSFRTGTSLEVKDDEATVKLLRAVLGETRAPDFIRSVEVPNLEALEALDDSELARFMVKRVSADKFTASPARVDFGKAISAAVAKNN